MKGTYDESEKVTGDKVASAAPRRKPAFFERNYFLEMTFMNSSLDYPIKLS